MLRPFIMIVCLFGHGVTGSEWAEWTNPYYRPIWAFCVCVRASARANILHLIPATYGIDTSNWHVLPFFRASIANTDRYRSVQNSHSRTNVAVANSHSKRKRYLSNDWIGNPGSVLCRCLKFVVFASKKKNKIYIYRKDVHQITNSNQFSIELDLKWHVTTIDNYGCEMTLSSVAEYRSTWMKCSSIGINKICA